MCRTWSSHFFKIAVISRPCYIIMYIWCRIVLSNITRIIHFPQTPSSCLRIASVIIERTGRRAEAGRRRHKQIHENNPPAVLTLTHVCGSAVVSESLAFRSPPPSSTSTRQAVRPLSLPPSLSQMLQVQKASQRVRIFFIRSRHHSHPRGPF